VTDSGHFSDWGRRTSLRFRKAGAAQAWSWLGCKRGELERGGWSDADPCFMQALGTSLWSVHRLHGKRGGKTWSEPSLTRNGLEPIWCLAQPIASGRKCFGSFPKTAAFFF